MKKAIQIATLIECSQAGCSQRFAPDLIYGTPGHCGRCEEPFCEEHLSDTDGAGDDGSGRYVTPLDDFYCAECIAELGNPEPPEYDW